MVGMAGPGSSLALCAWEKPCQKCDPAKPITRPTLAKKRPTHNQTPKGSGEPSTSQTRFQSHGKSAAKLTKNVHSCIRHIIGAYGSKEAAAMRQMVKTIPAVRQARARNATTMAPAAIARSRTEL